MKALPPLDVTVCFLVFALSVYLISAVNHFAIFFKTWSSINFTKQDRRLLRSAFHLVISSLNEKSQKDSLQRKRKALPHRKKAKSVFSLTGCTQCVSSVKAYSDFPGEVGEYGHTWLVTGRARLRHFLMDYRTKFRSFPGAESGSYWDKLAGFGWLEGNFSRIGIIFLDYLVNIIMLYL